ncbi:hypothetical protein [Brevundimonas sp. SGAir0440]|uniref:hypothetical protein n=1 Tax=Brevundimonas sp. SGAir0440 TaxID=2579977 RepID=UPI0010CCB1B8|nr:hypothetical protein [Brevundimonas sp. SGAir0440]QCQ98515.1 hypothetical protein E7T10_07465 [Brevundimonas sp. SGAir0440]
MKKIIALSFVSVIAACGDGVRSDQVEIANSDTDPTNEAVIASDQALPASAPAVVIADADKGRVCRAIIASLNGRQPDIIRVISHQGDEYRVRYTRDDGTVWTNDCIVGNGTAQWRMVENGVPGRWRSEDTINFTVDGEKIDVQTYMNGEPVTSDSYTIR